MATELNVALDPTRAPLPSTYSHFFDWAEVNLVVGVWAAQAREEVDDAYTDMKGFYQQEPDEVMRMCGGHSARLSELAMLIKRIEDHQPTLHWKLIRKDEIEPAMEELERQWRNASRLESVRELDWKMESGAR